MWLKNRPVQWAWLSLLLLVPIVLWILPAHFFDEGEFIVCPSRAWLGIECFGCGMTRAVMHFHHLEVADALYFNLGSAVVYPALIVVWAIWVYKAMLRLGLVKSRKKSDASSAP
ncbi:MAG: DUF2752 domain-containing protein [Bacteroidota bacterium]